MTPNELERIEQQLTVAGAAMQFPATPDLAGGFWKQIGAEPAQRTLPRQLWAGLAAVPVLAALVLFVAFGPARDAAADLVDRINFFATDESTEGLPTYVSGEETTVGLAQTALGKHILQPTAPEGLELKQVLRQGYGEVQVAALFYEGDDVSFVLFASNAFTGKGIPTDAVVEAAPVEGLGQEAYWVTGQRIVYSVRANGSLIIESQRLTDTNALIWDQDGDLYRIEGDLDKDEAIAIAHSLR